MAITTMNRVRTMGNSNSLLFVPMTRKEHLNSAQLLWNLLISALSRTLLAALSTRIARRGTAHKCALHGAPAARRQ